MASVCAGAAAVLPPSPLPLGAAVSGARPDGFGVEILAVGVGVLGSDDGTFGVAADWLAVATVVVCRAAGLVCFGAAAWPFPLPELIAGDGRDVGIPAALRAALKSFHSELDWGNF